MPPDTNKALIQQWIDAWSSNNLDLIDDLFAPDYTVNGVRIGVEGVKQGVKFFHSAFQTSWPS